MTTAVTSTEQTQNTAASTTSRVVQKSLGKDDFLKLMIEQLKAQNPLEPMSDTDSIAQMANFSSLEQMQNMNNSMNTLLTSFALSMQDNAVGYAVNLIGKEVGYYDGKTAKWGTVDSMKILDGTPLLTVGKSLIDMSQVFEVKPVTEET